MIFNDNLTVDIYERVHGSSVFDLLPTVLEGDDFWNSSDPEFMTQECIDLDLKSMSKYAMVVALRQTKLATERELAQNYLKVYVDWFQEFCVSFDNFGDYVDFEIITDKYGHVDRIVKLSCCNV